MVLPKLFSRNSSSSSPAGDKKKDPKDHATQSSRQGQGSRGTSVDFQRPLPSRTSTSTSSSLREKKSASASASAASAATSSPSKSRSTKSSSHRKSSSAAAKYDPDTHPLNLPPEERRKLSQLSRLSVNSQAMGDDQDIRSPSPANSANAAPQTNGAQNGAGADKDSAPAPPPHKETTSPPPGPTVDAEACKAAGNKFFKAREYEKAIAEYTKAVDAEPKNATYRSNRAAAYMSASKYVDALEDCKSADELEPNSPKILLRLARIYTSLGRPQEALDIYDQIVPPVSAKDRAPAASMANHIKEAEEQIRDGSSGSLALHALNEAEKGLGVTVNPPRKWRLLRGEAYLKMGNVNALGDAQNVAMALLRQNNADPEALVLRGRALYAQGEDEKALQHFRQAISCDPDFKDAVKYLRMVQKLNKTKEDGNNKFKTGKYQEAVNTYTEALAIDPQNRGTNSKILQNRALCYTKLKKYTEAIADCEKALKLDPTYTKARKTKAKAQGEAGDWEAAVKELKAIHESNPEEPGIVKEIRNAELELKKSKRKDYYKILGVEKDADDNQIKKAYRKLAIIHHPDKNQGDETAAERFKDIGEAYETLSDSQKRASYDSGEDLIDPSDMFGGGGGGMHGGFGGGGMGGGIDPEMLFNMMNGGGGGGGGGGFNFQSGGSPFGGGGRQRGAPQGFGGFPFG